MPLRSGRLDDRVALVTGASTGLGAQFARLLYQAGAQVLTTARRADLLEELGCECGARIEVMPGDITDASHRQALARRAGQARALGSSAGPRGPALPE